VTFSRFVWENEQKRVVRTKTLQEARNQGAATRAQWESVLQRLTGKQPFEMPPKASKGEYIETVSHGFPSLLKSPVC
jgi:hypothetical protein